MMTGVPGYPYFRKSPSATFRRPQELRQPPKAADDRASVGSSTARSEAVSTARSSQSLFCQNLGKGGFHWWRTPQNGWFMENPVKWMITRGTHDNIEIQKCLKSHWMGLNNAKSKWIWIQSLFLRICRVVAQLRKGRYGLDTSSHRGSKIGSENGTLSCYLMFSVVVLVLEFPQWPLWDGC